MIYGLELFAEELGGAFAAWVGALSAVVEDAGIPRKIACRRAEDAVVRLQGALVVTRGTNDPKFFKRMLAELPDQLLEASGS